MNWRVTGLILIALLGGMAVLFAIVTRPYRSATSRDLRQRYGADHGQR
jgi:hypothetical protein